MQTGIVKKREKSSSFEWFAVSSKTKHTKRISKIVCKKAVSNSVGDTGVFRENVTEYQMGGDIGLIKGQEQGRR